MYAVVVTNKHNNVTVYTFKNASDAIKFGRDCREGGQYTDVRLATVEEG